MAETILSLAAPIALVFLGNRLASRAAFSWLQPWWDGLERSATRGWIRSLVAALISFLCFSPTPPLVHLIAESRDRRPVALGIVTAAILLGSCASAAVLSLFTPSWGYAGVVMAILGVPLFHLTLYRLRILGQWLTGWGLTLLGLDLLIFGLPFLWRDPNRIRTLMEIASQPHGAALLALTGFVLGLLLRTPLASPLLLPSLVSLGLTALDASIFLPLGGIAGFTLLPLTMAPGLTRASRLRAFRLGLGLAIQTASTFLLLPILAALVHRVYPVQPAQAAVLFYALSCGIGAVLIPTTFLLQEHLRLGSRPQLDTESQKGTDRLALPRLIMGSPETNLEWFRTGLVGLIQANYELLLVVMDLTQTSSLAEEAQRRYAAIASRRQEILTRLRSGLVQMITLEFSDILARQIQRLQELSILAETEFDRLGRLIHHVSRLRGRKNPLAPKKVSRKLYELLTHVLDLNRFNQYLAQGSPKTAPDQLQTVKNLLDAIHGLRRQIRNLTRRRLEHHPTSVRKTLRLMELLELVHEIAHQEQMIGSLLLQSSVGPLRGPAPDSVTRQAGGS